MQFVTRKELNQLVRTSNYDQFQRNALSSILKVLPEEPVNGKYNANLVLAAMHSLTYGNVSKDLPIQAHLRTYQTAGINHYKAMFHTASGEEHDLNNPMGRKFADFWLQSPDQSHTLMLGNPIFRYLWNLTIAESDRAEVLNTKQTPLVRAAMDASAPLASLGLGDKDNRVTRDTYYVHLARVAAAKAVAAGYTAWPEKAASPAEMILRCNRIMKATGSNRANLKLHKDPYAIGEKGYSPVVGLDVQVFWKLLYKVASYKSAAYLAKQQQSLLMQAVWTTTMDAEPAGNPPADLRAAADAVLALGGVYEGDPSHARMHKGLLATHPDYLSPDVERAHRGIVRLISMLRKEGFKSPLQAGLFFRPTNAVTLTVAPPMPGSFAHLQAGPAFIDALTDEALATRTSSFSFSVRYNKDSTLLIKCSHLANQLLDHVVGTMGGKPQRKIKHLHPQAEFACAIKGNAMHIEGIKGPPVWPARQLVFRKRKGHQRVLDYNMGSAMLHTWKRFPMMAALVLHRVMNGLRLEQLEMDADLMLKPKPDLNLTDAQADAAAAFINGAIAGKPGHQTVGTPVLLPNANPKPVGTGKSWTVAQAQIKGTVDIEAAINQVSVRSLPPDSEVLALVDLNAVKIGGLPGWSGDPYLPGLRKDNDDWMSIKDAVELLKVAESGSADGFILSRLGEIGLPRYRGMPAYIMVRKIENQWLATIDSALGDRLETINFPPQDSVNTNALESLQGALAQIRDTDAYDRAYWETAKSTATGEIAEFMKRIRMPGKRAIAHA